MATKNENARARIDGIKANIRSTSTCTNATVVALQELLSRKNEEPCEKENVRVRTQAAARRKAGTVAAAADGTKQSSIGLVPKERYILATEVANGTLKALADALKNPPLLQPKLALDDNTRKHTKPRTGQAKTTSVPQKPLKERPASQLNGSPQKPSMRRRSSSYSSILTTGPDTGLVATAECARIAFAYLGTSEAAKVLGNDAQTLQYESGSLALIGKLVALGLDNLAVKELRVLKKRLDLHLDPVVGAKDTKAENMKPDAESAANAKKENLASLLNFRPIDPTGPALPLITNFQTYVLRVIAKMRRPHIVEAAWEYLQLSNPCSVTNLIWHHAQSSNGQAKAARQLECLAQTILALCPSISSADDTNKLQPVADTVLLLQHLAFKIRRRWWSLVKHQGNKEQELWEPFGKCIVAFARRSQFSPLEKYNLAEYLYTDLTEHHSDSQARDNDSYHSSAPKKILCSLAQAADLPDEALRWLGSSASSAVSEASAAKQASRSLRVLTVSLEALLKGNERSGLEEMAASALNTLKGSLGGSTSDLNTLFMEANALRRISTKLLVACLSKPGNVPGPASTERLAVAIIAASVHFSARYMGSKPSEGSDSKLHLRYSERTKTVWTCLKSMIDSVMACCRQTIESEDQWKELDTALQDSLLLLYQCETEPELAASGNGQENELIQTCIVKISNAYWAKYIQLKNARFDSKYIIAAMERSIDIVSTRSESDRDAGHLSMKLEQLGEALENLERGIPCRKALFQCIQSHLNLGLSRTLAQSATRMSIQQIFNNDGPFSNIARVLKAYHRSFIKFGVKTSDELAFYDDINLDTSTRGALLEWQLGLHLRTLSRNRHWDPSLNISIVSLLDTLHEIYIPKNYPLRRLRVSVMALQLSQNHSHMLSGKYQVSDLETPAILKCQGSEDAALQPFAGHLKALHRLKSMMQQKTLLTSSIEACFSTWDELVSSAASWNALTKVVDNIEDWLRDVQALVELLNVKGEEYVALTIQHFVVKAYELQKCPDSSDLVTALCTLSLQCLRLGYTGMAGLSFAKAERFLEHGTVSTEARLQWHIGYAEYLLGIGNGVKCANILTEAQSIALSDSQFRDLAKASTSLSGRVRFNRVMADASYVYSLYATAIGSFKAAARHARQCVTLNRRIWATFESRINVHRVASAEDSGSDVNSSNQGAFDPLSSMRNDKGIPLVMSVTHDALCGPEFWCLVPSLYRALMQHSQVFAHQGLLHEALFVAEQAEKVAKATDSPTFVIDNASWRADCWAQSGRIDKADAILESLNHLSSRKSLSVAGYYSALARAHHFKGQFREELSSYDTLINLLGELSSPSYIKSLETFSPSIDSLTEQISNMTVNSTEPVKPKPSARGRKPVTKSAPRTAGKATAKMQDKPKPAISKRKSPIPTTTEESSIITSCSTIGVLRASIMDRGVLASLLKDDLTYAFDLLEQAEKLQNGSNQEISHMWATFKAKFAQSIQQIAENFTVNTLPESTIAFPAIGLKERRLSEGPTAKRTGPGTSALTKGNRTQKQPKVDFSETLRNARELLVEAHGLSAANASNHLFQQISLALGHVTVLLSAVSGTELHGSLHPLYAAYMSEIPKCNALRLAKESIESDKEYMSKDDCLQWPTSSASNFTLSSISDFQQEYIDIIPETWTAVSLALNEDRSELYITRFERGLSPFLLRLPLTRHASREGDEEEFAFEDGKRDFDEIIELSDFGTKTAKDMTTKTARQQWWAEREALDTRLHELLLNIENIWLGGFKGVFSQHERQPSLLARFRKSLENIMNRHLPSRRKKTQHKQNMLDSRVLELFIGLGDATNEDLDMDEALMDLIYFVVDILQFNGEHNAYDEIDFDAMVVETYDALRAYHSASQKIESASRHTILVLDKNLHAFPWESLPCLSQLSISRLPSLVALRERLLYARASRVHQNAAPGHYIRAESGGTSFLNPSGDLTHTLKTLQPQLNHLRGSWNHFISRAPSEKDFEESLREQDLVLYFGHGSGAQYIKSKTVRRLYPGEQDADERQPSCATTLLFGCSSVHLTENGVYEPSGMLSSYLTAGAPAVVGMLWDVTDKDCDRLAVKAGELWGLWPEPQDPVAPKTPAKTPAKKTKGKGKAAEPVEDVEGARGAGSRRKAAMGKGNAGEDIGFGGDYRRGVALDEAVREARKACVLRYLNGAAAVVYGIPVFLE